MTATASFAGTVVSFVPGPWGGGIARVQLEDGNMRTAVLNAACSPREPEASERWRFTGESVRHPEHGDQLRCGVALPLLPSGQGIVRLLAESRRFPGIGRRTAMRLWGALGVRLYDVLSARDYEAVADVIGVELTAVVIDGFGLLSVEVTTLRWLDEHDVDPQTATTALQLWGGGVIARMEADPYTLALLEPWAAVDRRALAMGVYPFDDRRLVAAVEEAAAAVWRRRDTASGRQDLERMVLSLLGPGAGEHAGRAVEMAERLRLLLPSPDGLQLQNRAAHFMEREVECRLAQLLDPGSDDTLNENVRTTDRASATLDVASLSSEQNAAILLASTMRLCVIHGAAGTGKTTVVRGIVSAHLARDPSATVRLVAISGRAASRLDAALGEDGALNDERPSVPRACAMTVARFLREAAVLKTRPPSMLIVDEASMIDLPTAYQLLRAIPPNARVVMVGDPAQLPPIGPGLVFHRLVGDPVVPQRELRTVHRQEADTGIPQVAGAIRCGCLPALPMFDPDDALAAGVRIAPCRQSEIAATTLRYGELCRGRRRRRRDCPTRTDWISRSWRPLAPEPLASMRSTMPRMPWRPPCSRTCRDGDCDWEAGSCG